MRHDRQPIDGLEPRFVLRAYSFIVLGFLVARLIHDGVVRRPLGLPGADDPVVPFALLLCATAIASIENPRARRRNIAYFAVFHVSLCIILTIRMTHAAIHDRTSFWFLTSLGGVTLGLLYTWAMANGDPRPEWNRVVGIFRPGAKTPTQRATSDYEERIRAAAAQEERNRLARELHDSIKQQVFAIHTAAATAEARLTTDPNGAGEALAQVRAGARDAMLEMEAMLDQMRSGPLGNDGLIDALRKQSEALRLRTGADVSFTFGTLPAEHMVSASARQALVRVAQESLANVAKHARAKHVRIALDVVAEHLVLTVADDGAGYDQDQPTNGMGLVGMRTRADEVGGDFAITSKPGGGTNLRVAVPVFSAPTAELRSMALIAAGIVVLLLLSLKIGHVALIMLPLPILECVRLTLAWRRARKIAGTAS